MPTCVHCGQAVFSSGGVFGHMTDSGHWICDLSLSATEGLALAETYRKEAHDATETV